MNEEKPERFGAVVDVFGVNKVTGKREKLPHELGSGFCVGCQPSNCDYTMKDLGEEKR